MDRPRFGHNSDLRVVQNNGRHQKSRTRGYIDSDTAPFVESSPVRKLEGERKMTNMDSSGTYNLAHSIVTIEMKDGVMSNSAASKASNSVWVSP